MGREYYALGSEIDRSAEADPAPLELEIAAPCGGEFGDAGGHPLPAAGGVGGARLAAGHPGGVEDRHGEFGAADIDGEDHFRPRRNCGLRQSQTRHWAWSTSGRALHWFAAMEVAPRRLTSTPHTANVTNTARKTVLLCQKCATGTRKSVKNGVISAK